MNKKERESKEAIQFLLDRGIKPGSEIKCILRSVSRSGMNRKISLIFNGENISWYVAKIFKENCAEKFGHNALNCNGCGMDMGFNAVYNLGRYLFPKGFIPYKAGRKYGRNGTNPRKTDPDGGYALDYKWL